MTTTRQEFIDLAAELFEEFDDFASDAVITQKTAFTYATQAATSTSQTVGMIRTEFKESQINGELIKTGDYMLIGQYADLTFIPSPDNTTLTHDSIASRVINIDIDPAKAAFILHVRRS